MKNKDLFIHWLSIQVLLKNNKGVNVPGVSVQLPGMTEKDAEDILFGIREGVDFIAASFVRRASDVMEIRTLLERKWRSASANYPEN